MNTIGVPARVRVTKRIPAAISGSPPDSSTANIASQTAAAITAPPTRPVSASRAPARPRAASRAAPATTAWA
jgi:hypothetical protein